MAYISDEKLVIIGAAGAIGSNMAQAALTLKLTPNVCLYDPFEQGLKGVAEELRHCAFPGARVTATSDIAEALRGADYLISSGGAPRKEGMTREDLLRGNTEIAAELGRNIREHCPGLKLAVIIFNPADITGLTVLVHSGLPRERVATLAALDSTRLQSELAHHFDVPPDEVTGCRTYGGHGEMMSVFASTASVSGKPLTRLIGTDALTEKAWADIQQRVRQGGKRVIELRGRSSFQSPAHQSILMVKAVMDGEGYPWPCGMYVNEAGFNHTMMGIETTLTKEGVSGSIPVGTDQELAALKQSEEHLAKLRDSVIEMGVLPPITEWNSVNPNL